jgi:hypothetical protein
MKRSSCTTCYGTGEVVGENGSAICAHCFGDGLPPGQGAKVEWRLREIERNQPAGGRDREADILWLVHELRRNRDALVRVLTMCQDADEADAVALRIRFEINQALGLYPLNEPT